MTRAQANRLLAQTKAGIANPSEIEILFALMLTGDIEIQPFKRDAEGA